MSKETLKFNITLSAKHWNKLPVFSIWVNDQLIVKKELRPDTDIIEFEQELSQGEHDLKIRLENKNPLTDTVVENDEIVKDMLLNIDDITIDGISLGNLLWSAEYHLDQPCTYQDHTITKLDHCVNLGWNGTYILKFSSPYYIWLLEKL